MENTVIVGITITCIIGIILILFCLFLANVFPSHETLDEDLKDILVEYADIGHYVTLSIDTPYSIKTNDIGLYPILDSKDVQFTGSQNNIFGVKNTNVIKILEKNQYRVEGYFNVKVSLTDNYIGDIRLEIGVVKNDGLEFETYNVVTLSQEILYNIVMTPKTISCLPNDTLQFMIRVSDLSLYFECSSANFMVSALR